MKQFFSTLGLVLMVSLLFVGCSKKTIPIDKLQIRNDIAYEVNSEKPYTGKVIKYYSEPERKLENETNYSNGKKDGIMVTYFENQQKKGEYLFADGNPLNIQKWYSNGQQKCVITYKDNKLDECKKFHENGTLSFNLKVDWSKPYNRFDVFSEEGQEMQSLNYLNNDIVPIDSITKCFSLSEKDVAKTFGVCYPKSVGIFKSYTFIFTNKWIEDDGPEIADLILQWDNTSQKPFGVFITYKNSNEKELMAVKTKMKAQLESKGFGLVPKQDYITYENKEFRVTFRGPMMIDNYNIGFVFDKK